MPKRPDVIERRRDQGDALASYRLGYLYHSGSGVTEDHAEAVKWYRKAADQGNDLAQYSLGLLYDSGSGVTPGPRRSGEMVPAGCRQATPKPSSNSGACICSDGVSHGTISLRTLWWNLVVASGHDKLAAGGDAARGLECSRQDNGPDADSGKRRSSPASGGQSWQMLRQHKPHREECR